MADPNDDAYWDNLIARARKAWSEGKQSVQQDAADIQSGDFETSRLIPDALLRQTPGPGGPPMGPGPGSPMAPGVSQSSAQALARLQQQQTGAIPTGMYPPFLFSPPDVEPAEWGPPSDEERARQRATPRENAQQRQEREDAEAGAREDEQRRMESPEVKRAMEKERDRRRADDEEWYQYKKTHPKWRESF